MAAIPSLQTQINNFILSVEANPEMVADLWDAEFRRMAVAHTLSSVKLYITKYRNALREHFEQSEAILSVVNGKNIEHRIAQIVDPDSAPVEEAPGQDVSNHVTAATRLARGAILGAGRPPTLQKRMAGFFEALKEVSSPAEMQALWDKEFASLSHLALATQKNYASSYRKDAIALLGRYHPVVSILKAPESVYDAVNRDYAETTAARHRQLIHIPNWLELVKRAHVLIKSSDPFAIGIGLLLLTGRRPYEIFCTATFDRQPLAGNRRAFDKWHVSFAGQAKTKGADNSMYDKAYAVPVLAPAAIVIDAHRRMRSSDDAASRLAISDEDGERFEDIPWLNMSNEDFSRALAQRLGREYRDCFLDLWPRNVSLSPSKMRPLYAEIAYRHFCSRAVSRNSYYAAILGHRLDDLETSLSYIQFYLDEPDDGKNVARLQRQLAQRIEEVFNKPEGAGS